VYPVSAFFHRHICVASLVYSYRHGSRKGDAYWGTLETYVRAIYRVVVVVVGCAEAGEMRRGTYSVVAIACEDGGAARGCKGLWRDMV
jgi:hypothetical protein